MLDHLNILENAMKELGKILRINSKYFGLSNENINELQPIIQGTMQIYEMRINQVQSININTLRQLQQSQHIGLCSSKIFINEYQSFDKNIDKEKIEIFKNKIDYDFSDLNPQVTYLAFLSQFALLRSIEDGLSQLNDKFISERGAWYQQQFIRYVSKFINKVCDDEYKPYDFSHLINPALQTMMANFTIFEIQKDQAFLMDLEKINSGIDLNYTLENKSFDSFLKKFFNI